MHYTTLLCFSAFYIYYAQAWTSSKTCNLFDGVGCTGGSPFNFIFAGNNDVPNSLCRRTYRLQVDIGVNDTGFQCAFTMDRPEQSKYIYSMSLSSSATTETVTTPYIYGYGLDAFVRTSTAPVNSQFYNNYLKYNNIHTETDNNGFSTVTFRMEDYRLTVSGSAGHSAIVGNPYLFVPTTSTVYIGLNRRYADTKYIGSGLCKVYCYSF